MTSGGARARSGPAPQQDSIRNGRAGADWTRLPASGRLGDPPAWPLTKPTRRELEVWAKEWRRPQAIMWEANGQENEVADYVRAFVEAEKTRVVQTTTKHLKDGTRLVSRTTKPAPTSGRTLVKQMREYLALSQPGLDRNHWVIVGDPSAAVPGDSSAEPPIPISDARDRLRRMGDAG